MTIREGGSNYYSEPEWEYKEGSCVVGTRAKKDVASEQRFMAMD